MRKRTALVTGASSGIGEATALALQQDGYQVYAAARQVANMDSLKGSGIHLVQLDVTIEKSIVDVVKQIEKEEGTIDVLINNAGYGSYGAFEDVSMEEARRQVEVNLFGLARLTQLVIPKMRAQHSGTIINISSVAGRMGEKFGSWYHATKYALEGLSDSLALEMKPFGVNVILIEPGLIKTKWAALAAENLLKASGKGEYSAAAKKKAARMQQFNASRSASAPEVISKGIVKILRKRNPKFRYPLGGGAKLLMFLRRFTTDRTFYRLLGKVAD